MTNNKTLKIGLLMTTFLAFSLSGCANNASFENAVAKTSYTALEAQNPYLRDHISDLNYKLVSGQTIAYLDYGKSEDQTIILVHGIPTSSLLYRNVAQEIAANGYRVIAVDLLGFGSSDKPTDKSLYTYNAHSDRVFGLADELGVENFVLGIHDVGGVIGWEMLKSDTNRIDGLIAANTMAGLAGVTPSPMVMEIMTQQATPEQVWSKLDDADYAKETTYNFLVQGFSSEDQIPDGLTEAYAASLDDGSRYAFAAFFENLPSFMGTEPARRAAMSNFGKPTAIIFGEQDKFFASNVVVPDLKGSLGTREENITLIPNSGHFVQEQAPAAYSKAVVSFMESNFKK